MIFARPTVRRRVLAGLVPATLVAVALTLMAPTCGTMAPGMKTFSRRSLIIPMDLCYQSTGDEINSNYPAIGCPSAKTSGDVVKAYGLVYQLVRNNIAVYWVINQGKTAVTDIDMTVQYAGGPAVLKYDWSAGGTVQGPTLNKVDYRGGPFIVDGTDFARASAVLQAYKATFGAVNVHVSNVAFQGYVAKTMAGGWSAGGTVPPKLALLNIGSDGSGAKNAMPVIRGYLTHAGLDTTGAGGTTDAGKHGTIYDSLVMKDFVPTSGDWTNTNLYKNGYQVLWVPHWTAPRSCADCTDEAVNCSGRPNCTNPCPCISKYPASDVASALTSIGAFSASGKDVFAECAGLGSFDGVLATGSTTNYQGIYGPAVAGTHFQTAPPTGFWINKWPGGNTDGANLLRGFSSPFMQIGDYPFVVHTGAIEDYHPATAYQPGVVQFISDQSYPDYDVFTLMPPSGSHGTIVYLGGHSYSGTNGTYQIAGTRLVLNTLFNLGASCVESGVACNTGELGECAAGVMSCDASGSPYCKRIKGPTTEICDGKDNNCNGLVDESLDTECYTGTPASTKNVGICRAGVSSCVKRGDGTYGMSACTGDVKPAGEVCNGLDDDCDGTVDNQAGTSTPLSGACYTGPSTTLGPNGQPQGICKPGIAACTNGTWGDCAVCPADAWKTPATYPNCQILPQTQKCGADGTLPSGALADMTCTGTIQCGCTDGQTQTCYDGPADTLGNPPCHSGQRTCLNNSWGECNGQRTPGPKDCASPEDNDCNGVADSLEPSCNTCPPETDPTRICQVPGVTRVGGLPQGTCKDGVRACTNSVLGECSGVVLPSPEICDGKDNNCDGSTDENPETLCGANFTCVTGVCVPSSCGVESRCPQGFTCSSTGACERGGCGDPAVTCASGQTCEAGHCTDPCQGVQCGTGAICASGGCTGGGCYVTGCDAGKSCEGGVCVADPCGGSSCPAGALCRAGDCVQSCVYMQCGSGQICTVDGFCETDRCADKQCDAGQKCVDGTCETDPCNGLGCGSGQVCQGGVCADDPCNLVTCPVGACAAGQCYPVMPRDTSKPLSSSTGGGCGCGAGGASPLGALLFLAALPLARRRRTAKPSRRRGGGGSALVAIAFIVLLGGSACQAKKTSVDLSTCTHVCEGENRCVDLNFESAHCGRCDTVCSSGQLCVDGVCGPSSVGAPHVSSISPRQGSHGALIPVTVSLTGERFEAGAEVRVTSTTGTTSYPATVADAGHLAATIDLADLPVTELAVRVVNPSRVISNAVDFSVVVISPIIDSVDPAIVTTGGARPVTVHGSGFSNTSLCHSLDETGAPTGLVTDRNQDGTLTCWFDTTSLPPKDYPLTVVNDGTVSSNEKTVSVQSNTPVVAAVTPSVAQNGTIQNITITGSGFDVTAVVYFDWSNSPTAGCAAGTQVPTTFIGPAQLVVSQYPMPNDDVAHVSVKNGGGGSCSNFNLTLVSQGSPPNVSNLSVIPSPLYQADSATLTFGGSNFPATGTITVVPPSGSAFTATGVTGTTTTASGSASLVGKPDGLYNAYLTFANGITSGSFPFRVLSNVAVLRSASPGGGQAGATVPVTLTASNVRGTTGTVRVKLTGPNATDLTLTPTSVTATQVVVPVTLEGLATGVYQLAIVNANAAASNQVSFSVTPGTPTVTSITPSCVVQSDTLAQIAIAGTNFARANDGTAISQVMYSTDEVAFYPVPGTVTVTSAAAATVAFDTREAYVNPSTGFSTYYLQVWNPSTSGLLKSPAPNKTLKISNGACP